MVLEILAWQHLERFHFRFSKEIFFVEALHPVRQKADAGFEKAYLEFWEAIEHSIGNHRYDRQHLFKGMGRHVHTEIFVKARVADRNLGGGMKADGHAELLRFGVNRIELGLAQIQ